MDPRTRAMDLALLTEELSAEEEGKAKKR